MCNNNCNNAYLVALIQQNQLLLEAVQNLSSVNPNTVEDIKRMQAHRNPMTVAAEYPEVQVDRFIVVTEHVRFLDMLNTDMYIIFKIDNNNYNLPVYFKDSVGYEHEIVLQNGNSVLINQIQLNGIYSAKYQYTGGKIVLKNLVPINADDEPENTTVTKFKKNVRNK